MDKVPPQLEAQHVTSLSGFLQDVLRLAVYAVESGNLPDKIQMDELYRMWEVKITKQEMLTDDDISYLQNCYQILSLRLAPTTAISLRATENRHSHSDLSHMNTAAGRHVRNLWVFSFTVLAFIVFTNIYQYMFHTDAANIARIDTEAFNIANYIYTFNNNLIPFLYGAFGACIFMLRQAEEQLRERTFDPRRLPEQRNRLVLGTLSGGVIVLLYSSGGSEANVKITEAALGFIGGYSIDLLFSLLDRIVNTLKPAEESTQNTPPPPFIANHNTHAGKKSGAEQNMRRRLGDKDTPQLVPVANKEGDSMA